MWGSLSLAKPDCYAAVTVWTSAVERSVLSSPGSRVGDKCEQYRKGHEAKVYGVKYSKLYRRGPYM